MKASHCCEVTQATMTTCSIHKKDFIPNFVYIAVGRGDLSPTQWTSKHTTNTNENRMFAFVLLGSRFEI